MRFSPFATRNGDEVDGSFWQKIRRKSHLSPSSPSRPPSSPSTFPEQWQCIVHLKLLRMFARLQHDTVETFIHHHYKSDFNSLTINDNNTRNQIWQIYLELAFSRFEAWWRTMAPKHHDGSLKQIDISVCLEPGKLESLLQDTKPMVWSEKNLPPLDVIMVLHSFMLNPRCFLEDCIRFGMLPLWKAGMPWRVLDEVIDLPMNEYSVPASTRSSWTKATGLPWDLYQSRFEKTFSCPICEVIRTCRISLPSLSPTPQSEDTSSEPTTTTTYCQSCKTHFTAEQLSIHKLRTAVLNLTQRTIPLPGTILTANGLAQSSTITTTSDTTIINNLRTNPEPRFMLNRVLYFNIGSKILSMTIPSKTSVPHHSLQELERIIVEAYLSEQQQLDATTATATATTTINNSNDDNNNPNTQLSSIPPPPPPPSIIRKFQLQIHDTPSSPFSLSLSSAVLRQFSFTSTMENTCWLDSPTSSLTTITIPSLLSRYAIFFHIMSTHRSRVAVPTYAVDLAWHTHQLSPEAYYKYSIENTTAAARGGDEAGIFIDHDDRIDEEVRSDAFEWTGEMYEKMSGGRGYSECLCWFCSGALEVMDIECNIDMEMDKDEDKDTAKRPVFDENGHVRTTAEVERMVLNKIAERQYRKLEDDYALTCRQAELLNQPRPDKKDFLDSYVWLYPNARPAINV